MAYYEGPPWKGHPNFHCENCEYCTIDEPAMRRHVAVHDAATDAVAPVRASGLVSPSGDPLPSSLDPDFDGDSERIIDDEDEDEPDLTQIFGL
jgi:hypothetical protein